MAKRTPKNKREDVEYSDSLGNVYADFGFSNPEETKTKADLAILYSKTIQLKLVARDGKMPRANRNFSI